jgi:hypothetical protein
MGRKIWEFKAPGGWTQIDDIFENEEANGDSLKELELAGYMISPMMRLGMPDSGFYAEVFASLEHYGTGAAAFPYLYVVQLEMGGMIETVLVEDMPALIEILPKVSTIAEMAKLGAEQYEKQLDLRHSASKG